MELAIDVVRSGNAPAKRIRETKIGGNQLASLTVEAIICLR
jgi:hypothetical protein